MEHKIFLGKYRVAADEIALSGAEPVGGVAVAEQPTSTVVYRGEEIESGRDVSIEVIPAGSFKPVVREELEAEALAAKKLNHINIPAIYDFGIEDEHVIYVTEYFDGTSAEEWVNQHGPMPTGAVLRIALQVVSAMGASAFHKISHHAINPANLMLVPGQTPEGDWPLVKVLHFVGVAPTFASADTAVASFDKSSHYASPEQLQHGSVDFRSEIYSLGATMWFLLTGAPPLIAPNGPLAMQPTTNGLAVDKLNGMPKKVRRLLAQMLSVKAEDRPQDPLAFYRQIQDCHAQVDRRESMARRFGVPLFSRSNEVVVPGRRRFPAKGLALAAVLLAIAALAALLLPGYLRHQRVRQAEEPIGVPIGVSDATASAPPVNANVTDAAVPSTQAPTETSVASANTTQNPPANSADQNAPVPRSPESSPVAVANEVAAAPVKPLPTAPPANIEPKTEQPKVAANEAAPPQPQEETNPKPTESAPAEPRVVQSNRETEVTSAIPTARPVAPEVRRAEPAPPAEGPEEVTANTEAKVAPVSRSKKERVANMKRRPEKNEVRQPVVADEDEEPGAPMSQLPRGRVKARFIGVSADGNWMFELPSKKIVVVPAPPGG